VEGTYAQCTTAYLFLHGVAAGNARDDTPIARLVKIQALSPNVGHHYQDSDGAVWVVEHVHEIALRAIRKPSVH